MRRHSAPCTGPDAASESPHDNTTTEYGEEGQAREPEGCWKRRARVREEAVGGGGSGGGGYGGVWGRRD